MDDLIELYLALVTNGTGLFLLGILTVYSLRTFPPQIKTNKLMYALFAASFFELVTHLVTTVVQYWQFFHLRWLGVIMYSFVFVVNAVYMLVWVRYLTERLRTFGSTKHDYRKWLQVVELPSALLLTLSIVNMYTPVLFSYYDFDYVRLPGYYLTLIIPVLYLAYAMVLFARSQYKGRIYQIVPFGALLLPVVVSHVLESLFINLCVIPLANVLTLTILVLVNAKQSSSVDALTGLFTRNELYNHLSDARATKAAEQRLFGFMLDLDRFKSINDTYGHLAGDEALSDFAQVIKGTIPLDALCFRYAGDEFVILARLAGQDEAQALAQRVDDALAQFNRAAKKAYDLGASTGYTSWRDDDTLNSFIERMDQAMYTVKAAKDLPDRRKV